MKNRNLDFFSLLQAYTMGEQCGVIGAICRNYNRRIEIEEPSMPDKSIESTGRTRLQCSIYGDRFRLVE